MSVLVVGSLHLDVVLRAPHLPRVDETVTGSAVTYVFGGKGGNQALAAARMGGRTHFAGRAGSDRFGDMLRETLQTSGIDLSQLQHDTGPSGMSAAILNADGDYGAVIVSAANLNIDAEQIHIPTGTTLVLLQNEIPEAVNLAIAQKARDAGAQVWLNAAPARLLPDDLIGLIDLLILNRVEADFYSNETRFAKILTTLGAQGVVFEGNDHPAPKVKAHSSHGAGDMFVGALAAQVDAGKTLPEAIDFAQAAAALHVASDDVARATLSAKKVATFLNAQSNR
ncbi:PfkB family carbohydrate kinase [uncultured Tateyamaria sp.]|uniref:PfkB family carbohydrate kinase n=1 Tax=uncultured Tateyamaria sp. TaxID=455651 RepID=UPI002633E299|nr:PfkB family carbohydrate kinase [uncultured Tateyamaria sp.]